MISFKSVLVLWVLANIKNLPLVFHLRFYYYIVKNFYINNWRHVGTVFEPTKMTTLSTMLEMDFNLHKSNSTYFTDMDISRTDLLSLVLQKFFREYNDPEAPRLKWYQYVYSPLGSAYMVFKQEIPPYVPYEVESRIIGWTSKWLFVLSVFQSSSLNSARAKTIYAYGISKYVLKQHRKTISPEKAIDFVGLLTPDAVKRNQKVQAYLQDSLNLEEIIKVVGYYGNEIIK